MILIGDKESRRTEYFTKAAKEMGVFVDVMKPKEFECICHDRKSGYQDLQVKIDPFVYQSSNVKQMNQYIEEYRNFLKRMPQQKESGVVYLNTPQSILEVLDKRACKKKLLAHNIAVTPVLSEKVEQIEELHCVMQENRCSSVFLKPILGSGAVGIAAYRWNMHNGQEALYTSCKKIEDVFVNTKRICKLTDKKEIEEMLHLLISLDVIVEKWIPKARYQGKNFDLRVVSQFGTISYIVARQSDGPMTNLHLNNQALDYKNLQLPEDTVREIKKLCEQAMALYPGLKYAGIDILLDKKWRKPYIIEINGQGDCVYQDMYHENQIYKEQIAYILEKCKAPFGTQIINC